MKRSVIVIFCLLPILFLAFFLNSYYRGKQPETSLLSFTAPQKGEQVTTGQLLTCRGKFQFNPRNTKLEQIHLWLFLMDRDGNLIRYWIQRPVTFNKDGSWKGAVNPVQGTFQIAAVLADPSTNKLFETWLAKGDVTKQYELPRGAQILATVEIKTNN
jgi:hypothetical protein